MLDLELCQDVFGAELVGVVDGVQDHRLERMIALDDFGARLAQILPGLNGYLVDVQGIESGLGGQEERTVGLRAEGGLPDFCLPVHEHG